MTQNLTGIPVLNRTFLLTGTYGEMFRILHTFAQRTYCDMEKSLVPDWAKGLKRSVTVCVQYYGSPCGEIILGSTGGLLCLCDWKGKDSAVKNMRRIIKTLNADVREENSPVLERAKIQLDEYFSGKRKSFDLPLHPIGTPFQKSVWNELLKIPYGETRTYMQIAQQVDNVKGVRAVAQAIGANGICIVIPCHRVIGSDGSLTGFAGGLDVKQTLLGVETVH